MLEANPIYSILKKGNADDKLNLLKQLPDNSLKESARGLVTSANPMTTLLGFGSLLPSYCHGTDCEAAASLGKAVYRYGKESYLSGDYPDLFMTTVIDFAHSSLTALVNLGKYQEACNFLEDEMPFWDHFRRHPEEVRMNEQESLSNSLKSVLILKIDVLMHLNRIDEAWDLAFNDSNVEGNWSSDIELNRLRTNLKQIKQKGVVLDKDADQRRKEYDESQQSGNDSMFEALRKMMSDAGMDSSLIDQLKQSSHLDPYTRSGFNELEMILSKGEFYMQKGSDEVNEVSVRQNIRIATGIFVDNQPNKNQILDSLGVLKQSLDNAWRLSNDTLINDASYGLYLCYSRLNNSSAAADQLINLRKNLEKLRDGISDPLDRAGVFQTYPYLFYSLVEHLFKSNRFEEMLDAIEGSKGRIITDTLEEELAQANREFYLYNIHERLSVCLSAEKAHYISYHVDDECSYAVVVTKKGYIHATQIPIGKLHLKKWYERNLNNPLAWGSQFKKIDIIGELIPFVAWLKNLFETGAIEEGDHICYSADHLLYLFPIHYLKIKNLSLIEMCTVSRVHNAGHLLWLLGKSSSHSHPQRCLTVEVPSTDDIKDPKILKHFGQSASLLQNIYANKHDHLHHTQATLTKVLSDTKKCQLIHFSSHGFFPLSGNPFRNSGLLLSDHDQLPSLHIYDPDFRYNDEGQHLLSPERLLEGTKNNQLEECHVSLQACVAGYAREGIGGDALGIEWAMFLKGASSLISTFWNIDVQNANDFYRYFYQEWLVNGASRAVAHQRAILKLKGQKTNVDLPPEYFWAGYGLIGDWR